MSETDFQTKLLDAISEMREDLATTNAELRAVAARMDVQAETIAQYQIAIGRLQVEIAERRLACPLVKSVEDDLTAHKIECPLRARMDAVEDFVVAQTTKQADDDRWMAKLWPVIYAARGIAIYILAIHSAELLKFLQR